MSKNLLALALVAGTAASAVASTVNFTTIASVTFNNKGSIDAQGDVDNARDTWVVPAGSGGSITSVRVQGSLTQTQTGTFASEARVRMTAGAGSAFTAFNVQGTTTGGYVGHRDLLLRRFGDHERQLQPRHRPHRRRDPVHRRLQRLGRP